MPIKSKEENELDRIAKQANIKPKKLAYTKIRHEQFVKYYIESSNAEESAIRAGYSKSTARSISVSLLNKPKIQEMLLKYKQLLKESVIVTFEWKMQKLKSIVEYCLTPREYAVGGGSVVTKINEDGALKAIALMNQMQGHNAPTQSIQVNVQSTIEKLKNAQIEYKES